MIIKHVVTQEDRYKRGGIHNFNKFSDNFLVQKSGSYWGLEASAQMFLGNVCGGFLFDKEQRLKLNGSVGLGIF